MNSQLGSVGKWLAMIVAVWLAFTSFGNDLNYGRLTLALLIFWLGGVWLKQSLERNGRLDGWLLWGANATIAIIPGLILLGYGLFSPAQPSLTNSGVDVCQLETGWCISGSRVFIFWGGALLLAGLAWSTFMFTIEKKVSDRQTNN